MAMVVGCLLLQALLVVIHNLKKPGKILLELVYHHFWMPVDGAFGLFGLELTKPPKGRKLWARARLVEVVRVLV